MKLFMTAANLREQEEASERRMRMLAKLYVLKRHGNPLEAATAWGYCGA